jgi:hypothetical protein
LCATVIERNLWQLNNLPPLPTRFCTKKAGPPGIFTFTKTAVTKITGHKKQRPMKATNRSKIHFNIIIILFKVYFQKAKETFNGEQRPEEASQLA